MNCLIDRCTKRELESYIRMHQIYGTKALRLDRFTLSGAAESYKTGYYGRINCQEPWITYINSDELFRLGRLMLFYYKIEEKDGGCELSGKWRFPSWYRKLSVIYFILPFFIYWADNIKDFSVRGLGIFYLFAIAAYGVFYGLSRLSAPEDKITELIESINKEESNGNNKVEQI